MKTQEQELLDALGAVNYANGLDHSGYQFDVLLHLARELSYHVTSSTREACFDVAVAAAGGPCDGQPRAER